MKHSNARCQCCGERRTLTRHHVVPRACGRRMPLAVVVLLCWPCHTAYEDQAKTIKATMRALNWDDRLTPLFWQAHFTFWLARRSDRPLTRRMYDLRQHLGRMADAP